MRKFKLIYVTHRIKAKEPRGFLPMESDPSIHLYGYALYKKDKEFSFDEILRMYRFLPFLPKADRVGILSLIYWTYYSDFLAFLTELEKSGQRKYTLANLYFCKFHLQRWVSFIRYSDDTMFPQNEIIRATHAKMKQLYSIKK